LTYVWKRPTIMFSSLMTVKCTSWRQTLRKIACLGRNREASPEKPSLAHKSTTWRADSYVSAKAGWRRKA